jgi:hypothetical protein
VARIRSVSPDLPRSETCADWDREVRLAWVLLWTYLDDYGRGMDNARVIKSELFPLDDDVTAAVMGEWLSIIEKSGSICRYDHDGKRWLHVPKWAHWQKPQHPGKVRIPPCPIHEPGPLALFEAAQETELMRVSGKSHEGLRRPSPTSKEGEGELGVRRGRQSAEPPEKPPRCPRHARTRNPPSCGQCKELRQTWENSRDLDVPALGSIPPLLACPHHPGQFAGTCNGCAADRKAAT